MNKNILLLIAMFFLADMTRAQGVLEYEQISSDNEVYTCAGEQAALRVRCHHDIPLTFTSTMDKSAEPFNTTIEGTDSVYYIEFPTGNRYRGRIITITAPGYLPIEFPLELSPKEIVSLRVTDPNSTVDAGCYRTHRNKGIEEMKNANYAEARNQFMIAFECSDADIEENQRNINTIDTLIALREKADSYYDVLNYQEAGQLYTRIKSLNPYDSYTETRLSDCMVKFSSECTVAFKQAESYFEEKEYGKARELYQRIVDKGCYQSIMAADRITSIDRFLNAKKSHANVVTYEWIKGAPLGITIARFNDHRVGSFFHINLTPKIFEATRNNCVIGDTPEALLGFGWTIKIADPIWINFGPGFGAKLYFGDYKEKKYPGKDGKPTNPTDIEESEDKDLKINAAFSINPELGITCKYKFVAARVTYQYRFSLKKDLEDFMGKHYIMLGLGVAF